MSPLYAALFVVFLASNIVRTLFVIQVVLEWVAAIASHILGWESLVAASLYERRRWHSLCWPVVIATPINVIAALVLSDWFVLAVTVAAAAHAWRHRNCDDRWKRRAKTVLGVVREKAGRLVVVPEPASA